MVRMEYAEYSLLNMNWEVGSQRRFGSNSGLPLIGLYNLEYDILAETFPYKKNEKNVIYLICWFED